MNRVDVYARRPHLRYRDLFDRHRKLTLVDSKRSMTETGVELSTALLRPVG